MKMLVFISLLASFSSFAAPVLNKNVANPLSDMKIFADSEDPNHFYFVPVEMKLDVGNSFSAIALSDECGIRKKCNKRAIIMSMLRTPLDLDEFKFATFEISLKNPKATFSTVPVMKTKIEFPESTAGYFINKDCSGEGYLFGNSISCSFTLNARGIEVLATYLSAGAPLELKLKYEIQGVVESAPSQYQEEIKAYEMDVQFGGEELLDHPDLMKL